MQLTVSGVVGESERAARREGGTGPASHPRTATQRRGPGDAGQGRCTTASPPLSTSLGYQEGERIKLSTLLDFLERIARSVEVPVTADIKAECVESLGELDHTMLWVLTRSVCSTSLVLGRAGRLRWGKAEPATTAPLVGSASHGGGVALTVWGPGR